MLIASSQKELLEISKRKEIMPNGHPYIVKDEYFDFPVHNVRIDMWWKAENDQEKQIREDKLKEPF